MKYFIAIGNKQEGPFKLEELTELIIDPETLIWKEGTSDWVKITDLDELRGVIKIFKPKGVIIAPPPLPPKTKSTSSVDQDILLKQIELKKQLLQISFKNKKEKTLVILKSNLNLFILTIPLTVCAYFILAYFKGGFTDISYKRQYAQYSGSALNRNLVDYNHYDKLPETYKKQLKLESQIEDLMNNHAKENELTPSMYLSLAKYHSDMNKNVKWPGNTYGFKEGTVALDYNTFLDDRINAAFYALTALEAFGIFILLNACIYNWNSIKLKKRTV